MSYADTERQFAFELDLVAGQVVRRGRREREPHRQDEGGSNEEPAATAHFVKMLAHPNRGALPIKRNV